MNDFATPASLQLPYQTPMTFGQILDRIFRLMRSNLRLFIGIAAVPAGASALIFALVFATAFVPIIRNLSKQPDPRVLVGTMVPSFLFVMLLNLALFALYLAASIHAAARADMGMKVTFREAYEFAWKRAGRVFWLLFLVYLIAFLPLLLAELILVLPMGLFSMTKSAPSSELFLLIPIGVLVFLAAMVYGVIMALRLSLAFPASLSEDLTAGAAIRRSGQLTQGAKGRIFLVLLVIYALAYAVEMVGFVVLMVVYGVGALVMAVLRLQPDSLPSILGIGLAVVCLLGFFFIWIALIWSAFSTSFAVLYHDQRLRKDGPLPAPIAAGETA